MDAGRLGSSADTLAQLRILADALLQPECNVLLQGIRKQKILLRHIGHVTVQHCQRVLRDRLSVQQQSPLLTVIHPQKQISQTGLTAAGSAQNPQHLPLLHMKAHILQHGFLSVGIGKGKIVQRDVPPDMDILRIRSLRLVHDVRLLPEDTGYPLKRRYRLTEAIDAVAAGNHGPHQHSDIGIERYELADGDLFRQHHPPSEQKRQKKAQARDQVQQRPEHRPQLHHGKILLHAVYTGLFKSLEVLFLLHEGLQHPHPGQTFLHLVG